MAIEHEKPQLVKWEKWRDHNEREKQEHGTDWQSTG